MISVGVYPDKVLETAPGVAESAVFDQLAADASSARWLAGRADVQGVVDRMGCAVTAAINQHVMEYSARGRDTVTASNHTVLAPRAASWITSAEGRSFRLLVSPGTVGLAVTDTNKAEKAEARRLALASTTVDLSAAWINAAESLEAGMAEVGRASVNWETGELYEAPQLAGSTSEVLEWSKRSRMRMVRTVASLDYSDWGSEAGSLAMVTLTYPGDWKGLAPNGRAVKAHMEALRKRWRRALGDKSWRVLWKLEFQKRGAPHIHFLARVPATVTWSGGYDARHKYGSGFVSPFEEWLSMSWAQVVGASTAARCDVATRKEYTEFGRHLVAGTGVDFSGKKFNDPRRIALYFLGHSMKSTDGKEYQHIVPELWRSPGNGPGRFWGYSGFESAEVALELTLRDFQRLAREFRKLQRARDWKAKLVRHRGMVYGRTGVAWTAPESTALPAHRIGVYKRRTRAMGAGGSIMGGWVLLNDALPVILAYAGWLETR